MAMSDKEILTIYETSVPQEFERQLLRRLFGSYQAAGQLCSEFSQPERHDLLPHVRRGIFESDLRGLGNVCGFPSAAHLNKTKNNYHTLVFAGRIAMTASAVASPNTVVRPAEFRDDLSVTNQLDLYEEESDPLYLYGILLHGAAEKNASQPGFCRVAFPNRGCDCYLFVVDVFTRHPNLVAELQNGGVELIGDEVWPQLRRDIPRQQNE